MRRVESYQHTARVIASAEDRRRASADRDGRVFPGREDNVTEPSCPSIDDQLRRQRHAAIPDR